LWQYQWLLIPLPQLVASLGGSLAAKQLPPGLPHSHSKGQVLAEGSRRVVKFPAAAVAAAVAAMEAGVAAAAVSGRQASQTSECRPSKY